MRLRTIVSLALSAALLAGSGDEGRVAGGNVTPGKFADIIAVGGDVLRYISLLQRVDGVVKHGVRYK